MSEEEPDENLEHLVLIFRVEPDGACTYALVPLFLVRLHVLSMIDNVTHYCIWNDVRSMSRCLCFIETDGTQVSPLNDRKAFGRAEEELVRNVTNNHTRMVSSLVAFLTATYSGRFALPLTAVAEIRRLEYLQDGPNRWTLLRVRNSCRSQPGWSRWSKEMGRLLLPQFPCLPGACASEGTRASAMFPKSAAAEEAS